MKTMITGDNGFYQHGVTIVSMCTEQEYGGDWDKSLNDGG